jgi:hypothetical protein
MWIYDLYFLIRCSGSKARLALSFSGLNHLYTLCAFLQSCGVCRLVASGENPLENQITFDKEIVLLWIFFFTRQDTKTKPIFLQVSKSPGHTGCLQNVPVNPAPPLNEPVVQPADAAALPDRTRASAPDTSVTERMAKEAEANTTATGTAVTAGGLTVNTIETVAGLTVETVAGLTVNTTEEAAGTEVTASTTSATRLTGWAERVPGWPEKVTQWAERVAGMAEEAAEAAEAAAPNLHLAAAVDMAAKAGTAANAARVRKSQRERDEAAKATEARRPLKF